MSENIALILCGLAMFLYSINQLSAVMKSTFNDQSERIIKKFTSNLFMAILIGCIITILLGSSSPVIIITIMFVNGGALNFRRAMGIVMGANIGTTFSSQLISMDIGKYAFALIFIGLILQAIAKRPNRKIIGIALIYFGMLFSGLFVMGEAALPFKESALFETWMSSVDSPLYGALIGGIVTLVIQSSSATIGLAIELGKQGMMTSFAGIAITLGAELGTVSDTLLATIKGSRQAIKTGLFHFFYSLITICLGLLSIDPFIDFVDYFTSTDAINRMIANAHVLFNLLGVIIFLPLVGISEKLMNRMIPEKVE